jgi:hypothetical protein
MACRLPPQHRFSTLAELAMKVTAGHRPALPQCRSTKVAETTRPGKRKIHPKKEGCELPTGGDPPQLA